MRIKGIEILTSIFFFVIICNCRSYISFESLENYYKGEIKILNREKISLKFRLSFDSLNNINIKLYNSTGFKIGNFLINNDSLSIIYVYDSSYNESIINFYKKVNSELFLNRLIISLLKNEIIEKNESILKNKNCKIENLYINNEEQEINIFSRDCKKMITIIEKKGIGFKVMKKFEIIVSKNSKIELTFIKI